MAFEQTRFTIVANAAGSGTWRMWNYIPSADAAGDDFAEPGYFGGMADHVHAGDMLVVATAGAVALMAFGVTGADRAVVAVPMSRAAMPGDSAAPMPQEMPGGSQPVQGPSTTADEMQPEG